MEAIWWLFVFVAWACYLTREKEMATSGQWYLIFRYSWKRGDFVRSREPVDGVFATNTDVAIEKAMTRIDHRADECFEARWCSTLAMKQHAAELDGRHVCEWWSVEEFVEQMRGPTYSGDQDKYTCKKDAKK